jgi:hypothetical protein
MTWISENSSSILGLQYLAKVRHQAAGRSQSPTVNINDTFEKILKFFEFSLFTCTRAVLDGNFVSEISIIKGNLQECGATMQVIQQMKIHLILLPREIVLFSRGSRPMFPETKLRETLRVEEKQNYFPKEQTLSVLLYSDETKINYNSCIS